MIFLCWRALHTLNECKRALLKLVRSECSFFICWRALIESFDWLIMLERYWESRLSQIIFFFAGVLEYVLVVLDATDKTGWEYFVALWSAWHTRLWMQWLNPLLSQIMYLLCWSRHWLNQLIQSMSWHWRALPTLNVIIPEGTDRTGWARECRSRSCSVQTEKKHNKQFFSVRKNFLSYKRDNYSFDQS